MGDKISFPLHALRHSITSFGSSSRQMGSYQTGDSMQTTLLLMFVSLSPSFLFDLVYFTEKYKFNSLLFYEKHKFDLKWSC